MSKSVGTCGHELPYEWEHCGAANVAVKDHDRQGYRVVAYKTICHDCRARYVNAGELLVTERQRNLWLKGDPMHREDS